MIIQMSIEKQIKAMIQMEIIDMKEYHEEYGDHVLFKCGMSNDFFFLSFLFLFSSIRFRCYHDV